jgi:hypothetical protein
MKTLEELKAKIEELTKLNDKIKEISPDIDFCHFTIKNVSISVMFELAAEMDYNIFECGGSLCIIRSNTFYKGGDIHIHSVKCKRTEPSVEQFEEIIDN